MTLPAAAAGGSGWLHTDGATIRTEDERPYVIKAVAWFGMETPGCAPHGLWQIGLDEGLAQIASFGFTTVRLPFSNACLHASATTGIDARSNPELVGLSPLRADGPGGGSGQGPRSDGDPGPAPAGLVGTVAPLVHRSGPRVPVDRRLADARRALCRGRHGDRRRSPQRAARRGVLGLRRPAAGLGGRRHPGRKRCSGRESSPPGDHRRGGAAGQRGGHLVGRGTGRRPTAPGPPVRARPRRLLPARLPVVPLSAVLVHRPGLSRQPARAVGPHLGLPGHRERRPGAAGRVRHPAADRFRPAVVDHARAVPRPEQDQLRVLVVQSEQR